MFTCCCRRRGRRLLRHGGAPYDPVVQLSTVVSRLAVMEGRTLAVAAYRTKLDDDFEIASTDPAERAAIERGMDQTAERIERDMDPIASAARMDTDEVIRLSELRTWLQALAERLQAPGTRRIKNPGSGVHDPRSSRQSPRLPPSARRETRSRRARAGARPLASPMEGHGTAPRRPSPRSSRSGHGVSGRNRRARRGDEDVHARRVVAPGTARLGAAGWRGRAAGDVIAWLRPDQGPRAESTSRSPRSTQWAPRSRPRCRATWDVPPSPRTPPTSFRRPGTPGPGPHRSG